MAPLHGLSARACCTKLQSISEMKMSTILIDRLIDRYMDRYIDSYIDVYIDISIHKLIET